MNDKVAVVTGGGRGIGRATCVRLGQAGTQVIAASRKEYQLQETRKAVDAAGGRCHIQVCDVTCPEALERLMHDAARRFGRIDILVNNAGYAAMESAARMPPTEFETLLRVNIGGVFYATKYVWPVMAKQGGGVIINLSSQAAKDPFPGLGTYGAAKAWVGAFTRGIAAEGKKDGIRAFAVGPGAVETEMLRAVAPEFPADQCLNPNEVADVVYTLCQPGMGYASGQTFYIRK